MLTDQLNQLLDALGISLPGGIQHPTDLTPSLLLAILESLLQARLPISRELRRSKDHDAKMKIFLGVLQHDVLQGSLELTSIDPRRLARGDWDAVVKIAEVLCWLGRNMDLIQENTTSSPTTSTTMTRTLTHSASVSMETPPTTPNEEDSEDEEETRMPRCIHEIPSPIVVPLSPGARWQSHSSSMDSRLLSLERKISPPVRHSGLISVADDDMEIASFESSLNSSTMLRRPRRRLFDSAYESQQRETVVLLKERARLLTEIARLQHA
ncbi:hypothetical protein CYLTODRAFT_487410 [Cylindrobasidium torrendii FP15055 ss-10]|uniref:DUF5745 domain-containing protein n=1 Tax=Cylindrobasidium torrendii FP15055 ss-10 TaxID=1314674 RepID=A0A0D7BL74_9AGAR|nr:hypothetical protein CYLTODRAFT_487410 [Cylindrobasidium torrendii FP15055 ss-10]